MPMMWISDGYTLAPFTGIRVCPTTRPNSDKWRIILINPDNAGGDSFARTLGEYVYESAATAVLDGVMERIESLCGPPQYDVKYGVQIPKKYVIDLREVEKAVLGEGSGGDENI